MSSFVVPPTSGVKTSLLSPKTPWHDAHFASHTAMPWATEPEPVGRPLKSGRTSMSQAATSPGVAGRPMPLMATPCADAAQPSASVAASTARPASGYDSWTFLTSPLSSTSQVWIALL